MSTAAERLVSNGKAPCHSADPFAKRTEELGDEEGALSRPPGRDGDDDDVLDYRGSRDAAAAPFGAPAPEAAGGGSSSAVVATNVGDVRVSSELVGGFRIREGAEPFRTAAQLARRTVILKLARSKVTLTLAGLEYAPLPPAGWLWPEARDWIEVEVKIGDDATWIDCEVLQVNPRWSGLFEARIVLPDNSDRWNDWFSWQEEDVDWRRIPILEAAEGPASPSEGGTAGTSPSARSASEAVS